LIPSANAKINGMRLHSAAAGGILSSWSYHLPTGTTFVDQTSRIGEESAGL
jgi:hypothetical protein